GLGVVPVHDAIICNDAEILVAGIVEGNYKTAIAPHVVHVSPNQTALACPWGILPSEGSTVNGATGLIPVDLLVTLTVERIEGAVEHSGRVFAVAVAEGVIVIIDAVEVLMLGVIVAVEKNVGARRWGPKVACVGGVPHGMLEEVFVLLAPARVERKTVIVDAFVY